MKIVGFISSHGCQELRIFKSTRVNDVQTRLFQTFSNSNMVLDEIDLVDFAFQNAKNRLSETSYHLFCSKFIMFNAIKYLNGICK